MLTRLMPRKHATRCQLCTGVKNEHGTIGRNRSEARPGRRCRKRPAAKRSDCKKSSLAQNRQVDADQKAELAAGIGQTEQDQESSERDADGRRLWEDPSTRPRSSPEKLAELAAAARQSKDATGQSGTKLDLTG